MNYFVGVLAKANNVSLSCYRFKHLEDAAKEEVQKLEDSAASKIGNRKKEESSSTDLLDPMGTSTIDFSGGLLSNLFGAGLAMARQPWWKG
jgi:hypothetical protein